MQTGDGLLVRLNLAEGGMTPEELAALCGLATRHGNGIVEVTARGSFQIRGLTPASTPLLEAGVAALGLQLREGIPVETSPLAGLDPQETADPLPLVRAIREITERAGLSGRLGPKVSVMVDAGGAVDLSDILADVRLTAARQGEAVSWHLAIAGNARTARPVAALDERDAIVAVIALLEAIAARGMDARARDLAPAAMTALLSSFTGVSSRFAQQIHRAGGTMEGQQTPGRCEAAGTRPGRCRQAGEGQPPAPHPFAPPSVLPDISPTRGEIGLPLPSLSSCKVDDWRQPLGQPISPRVGEMSGRTEGGNVGRQPSASVPLADSRLALTVALPFGSMEAAGLAAFARAAARHGVADIRLAPSRSLILLCPTPAAARLVAADAPSHGLILDPADPRRTIAACPGAPACASGRIATRALARRLAERGGFPGSVHVSGCAKGCAHPSPARIVLVGTEAGPALVRDGRAGDKPTAIFPDAEAALAALAALPEPAE
jgi:precorrin-3B synthase